MKPASIKAQREVVAALVAAGCGILRHRPTTEPTQRPTSEPVRDWLHVATQAYSPPTLLQVLRVVAARTGSTLAEMQSDSRLPRIVRSRAIYYYAARRLTRWGTPTIGKKVGGKDHSTVMHGISKVEKQPHLFEPELGEILAALSPKDDTAP